MRNEFFLITSAVSTVKAKSVNLLGTFSWKKQLGCSTKMLDYQVSLLSYKAEMGMPFLH